MSTMDLYEYFKKGMIEMTKLNFNSASNRPEPAMFLGVRKSVLPKISKMIPQALLDEHKHEFENENAIHAIYMPLGMLFRDMGSPIASDIGKGIARKLMAETIQEIRKHDYNAVMFSAFITEAFVKVNHLPKNGKGTEVDEFLNSKDYKRPSLDPTSEEKVMISLETQNSSEMIMFDIVENKETDFLELVNEKQIGDSKTPMQGLFGGLIYNGINSNHN